jgi:hypothetical protein
MAFKVRKRHFSSTLYLKINILPRQARDKHRENSKKCRFSQRCVGRKHGCPCGHAVHPANMFRASKRNIDGSMNVCKTCASHKAIDSVNEVVSGLYQGVLVRTLECGHPACEWETQLQFREWLFWRLVGAENAITVSGFLSFSKHRVNLPKTSLGQSC